MIDKLGLLVSPAFAGFFLSVLVPGFRILLLMDF